MTTLVETLYQYALEHLAHPYLHEEPDYPDAEVYSDLHEKGLRSSLSGEQLECLEKLLEERDLLSSISQKAMFRAGFRLAIELFL